MLSVNGYTLPLHLSNGPSDMPEPVNTFVYKTVTNRYIGIMADERPQPGDLLILRLKTELQKIKTPFRYSALKFRLRTPRGTNQTVPFG